MREHLVASFDEALERADRLISNMGDLAGKMVAAATYALLTADVGLAERVIADDAVLDAKQYSKNWSTCWSRPARGRSSRST